MLSNSQTLCQCYFHLLRKGYRSVWEFDKFLNDGHAVVWRTSRGIWRTITFNVILNITIIIRKKNVPSSGTKWLPIMTYIHPLKTVIKARYNIVFILKKIAFIFLIKLLNYIPWLPLVWYSVNGKWTGFTNTINR